MRLVWIAVTIVLACGACGDDLRIGPDAPNGRDLGVINGECTGQPGAPRVLVYTFESIWRHPSNFSAWVALLGMCGSLGFNVTSTNDPRALNATRLAEFDVVVFALTSGPGMDELGHRDMEAWMRAGGGLVGLHSASATESDWRFYTDNIGARFAGHAPGLHAAQVQILPGHPITDGLASTFMHTDEWYFFQTRPEEVPGMEMLLALDESTLPADYPAELKQGYHPIGWASEQFGGRVFYTAIGHSEQSFSDSTILSIIGRSIEWAAHRR